MKKLSILCVSLLILFVVVYALDYVESSNGLQTPELDGGRTEIEMVDINGDGNIDILSIGDHGNPYVNTDEHGVMVWFGDGQGNWSVYQYGNFGYGGIAIGDLNNDGNLDIGYGMHHNYSSSDLGDSILEAALGDGTGQNWIPWDDGISIGDTDPWGMFCTDFADIDNDGDLDLGANAFGADDGVHLFLNNGDGTWTPCFGFLGGNSTMDFVFGDVNGDGNADFAVAHQYGSIYLGDGNGGFTSADGNLPPAGNLGRMGPSLGDVDNDGCQDFAFCNSNGGVEVWVWQGNNTWTDFSGNLPTSGPYSGTQLYDMNIDGFMDVCAFGDSTVTVWLGDGTGNWTEATTFYTPGPGSYAAFRVGGDCDHNGYPDIALVGEEGDSWNAINHLRFFKESSSPGSLFVFPIYPRGGEKFFAGTVHFIKWTCGVPQGNSATIRLELSISGPSGPWNLIADNLVNNGQYQWLIDSGISSNNCYIRYTAVSGSDTAIALTPTNFIISPAQPVEEIHQGYVNSSQLLVRPNILRKRVLIELCSGGSGAELNIYDRSGALIRHLFTVKGRGKIKLYWDGKDKNGRTVPQGEYFVRLENSRGSASKVVKID